MSIGGIGSMEMLLLSCVFGVLGLAVPLAITALLFMIYQKINNIEALLKTINNGSTPAMGGHTDSQPEPDDRSR